MAGKEGRECPGETRAAFTILGFGKDRRGCEDLENCNLKGPRPLLLTDAGSKAVWPRE